MPSLPAWGHPRRAPARGAPGGGRPNPGEFSKRSCVFARGALSRRCHFKKGPGSPCTSSLYWRAPNRTLRPRWATRGGEAWKAHTRSRVFQSKAPPSRARAVRVGRRCAFRGARGAKSAPPGGSGAEKDVWLGVPRST
eukprot:scaffold3064_cov221-Prasinococcus_capsulatus_cf.AAC.1